MTAWVAALGSACPPAVPPDAPEEEREGAGAATWVKSLGVEGADLELRAVAGTKGGASYQVAVMSREAGDAVSSTLVTMRVDANGDLSWARGYLGDNRPAGLSRVVGAVEARDGSGRVWAAGKDGGTVIALDARGQVVFTQSYGTDVSLSGIAATADGGFVIAGNTPASDGRRALPAGDLWLHRADANGAARWTVTSDDLGDAELVQRVLVDDRGAVVLVGQRVDSAVDPAHFFGVAGFWVARFSGEDGARDFSLVVDDAIDDGAGLAAFTAPAHPASTLLYPSVIAAGWGADGGPSQARVLGVEWPWPAFGPGPFEDGLVDLGPGPAAFVDLVPWDRVSNATLDLRDLLGAGFYSVVGADGVASRRWVLRVVMRGDGELVPGLEWGLDELGLGGMAIGRFARKTPTEVSDYRLLAVPGEGGARSQMVTLAVEDLRVSAMRPVVATDFSATSDGGAVVWTDKRIARIGEDDVERWSLELEGAVGRGAVSVVPVRGRDGVDRGALVFAPSATGTVAIAYDADGAVQSAGQLAGLTPVGAVALEGAAGGADALLVARDGEGEAARGVLVRLTRDLVVVSAETLGGDVGAAGPAASGGQIVVPTQLGVLVLDRAGLASGLWSGLVGEVRATSDGGVWAVPSPALASVIGGSLLVRRYGPDGTLRFERSIARRVADPLGYKLGTPALAVRADGGLLIAMTFLNWGLGESCLDPESCSDLLIASLDPSGDLAWSTVYGGAKAETVPSADGWGSVSLNPRAPIAAVATPDNGLLLGALTRSYLTPLSSVFALRLDADGGVAAGCAARRESRVELEVRAPATPSTAAVSRGAAPPLVARGVALTPLPVGSDPVSVTVARSCSGVARTPTLTVTVEGQGRVTTTPAGIDCGDDCVQSFPTRTAVVLEATPADGFRVAQWSGDCEGAAALVTLRMEGDRSCGVRFVQGVAEPTCRNDAECAGDPRDDGDLCNGKWVCRDGGCVDDGVAVRCDRDGDTACRRAACVPETGRCEPVTLEGVACDDGDPCTGGDHCVGGACLGGADRCGCASDADCVAQEDGDLCNGTLVCGVAGVCVVDVATVVSCAALGPDDCRESVCAPSSGRCEVAPRANACDDGDVCTSDRCDLARGVCLNEADAARCDDGDPCTVDTCAAATGACGHDASAANAACAGSGCGDRCDPRTGGCVASSACAAPTGLVAVARGGDVVLTWSAAPGSEGTNLYVTFAPGLSVAFGGRITGVTSPYVLSGLAPGAPAYFVVTSVNGPYESGPSNEVSATPTTADTRAPRLLCTSPTDGAIGVDPARPLVLSFDEAIDPASVTTGLRVLGPSGAVAGTASVDGGELRFTPSAALAQSASYSVEVGGEVPGGLRDLAGNPVENPRTWRFVTRPAAPTGLALVASARRTTLTWSPVAGARGYTIYRAESAGDTPTRRTGVRRPVYGEDNLFGGTYFVSVTTSAGESGLSAGAAWALGLDALDPAVGVVARPGEGASLVTWTAPYVPSQVVTGTAADDTFHTTAPHGLVVGERVSLVALSGGAGASEGVYAVSAVPSDTRFKLAGVAFSTDVDGAWVTPWLSYDLLRASTDDGAFTVIAAQLETSAYVDAGLVNGQTYRYALRSRSGAHLGTLSDEASVTPRGDLPRAPGGLVVTEDGPWFAVDWAPAAGATRYVVYVVQDGAATPRELTSEDVAFIARGSVDTSRPFGFSVVGVSASGALGVPAGPVAPGLGVPPEIGPATLYDASPGVGGARLRWGIVPGATSYVVEKTLDPGAASPVWFNTSEVTGADAFVSCLADESCGFRVVASSRGGAYRAPPSNVRVVSMPPAGPSQPAGVVAYAGDGCVTLVWAQVPEAVWYTTSVRAAAPSPFVPFDFGTDGSGTMVTRCGLLNGVAAEFQVEAVFNGLPSWASEPVSATPSASRPSSPPASAVPGAGRIDVTWDDPGAGPGTRYHLWRHHAGTSGWVELGVTTVMSFRDNGAGEGLGFEYAVQVERGGVRGAFGERSTVVAAQPALRAPTGMFARPGAGCATVSWDVDPTALWYTVYRATRPGGPYDAVDFGTWTWDDEAIVCGLPDGAPVYFVVRAVLPSGTTGYSDEATTTPLASAPSAPASVSARAGHEAVALTWDVVPGATLYHVYRSAFGAAWVEIGTSTTSGFIDRGVGDAYAGQNASYLYRVAAEGVGGVGAKSVSAAYASPSARYADPPRGLRLQPGPECFTLSWDPVPGARWYWAVQAPGAEGPFGPLGGGTNYASETHWTHCVEAGAAAPDVASVETELLTGFSRSLPAPAVAVDLDAARPPAPSCQALAGEGQSLVSWAEVPGATRYHVYRRTLSSPWAEVAANAEAGLVDGCLDDGETYTYAVQSEGDAGRGEIAPLECQASPTTRQVAAPDAVVVEAGGGCATVHWAPVAGARWYNVLRGPTREGPFDAIGATNDAFDTAWTHCADAAAGAWFLVQSVGPIDSSGFSPARGAAVVGAPRAEDLVVSTAGAGALSATWTPVPGAFAYRVWRRGEDAGWSLVGQAIAAAYVDRGLASGQVYGYAVQAVTLAGPGAWSAPASATTP